MSDVLHVMLCWVYALQIISQFCVRFTGIKNPLEKGLFEALTDCMNDAMVTLCVPRAWPHHIQIHWMPLSLDARHAHGLTDRIVGEKARTDVADFDHVQANINLMLHLM